MKSAVALLMCLLALGVASAEVKTLTKDNFDSTLAGAEVALVKFYAPWCGHCKKLAPEFKSASEKLGDKALLVQVNCDDDQQLCGKYGVRGYPTLQIFRKGAKAEDYGGGRSSEDIVKYMIANSGPAHTYVSSAEEFAKMPMLDAKLLAMTSSKTSKLAQLVEEVAPSLRNSISFAIATDKAAASGVEMETVAVYRDGDEPEIFSASDSTSRDDLEQFLKRARVPLLGEISPATGQMYQELSAESIAWLFLGSADREKNLKVATAVAKKFRSSLFMLWLDTEKYEGVPEQLGVPKGTKFPAFVIDKNRKHHVLPVDTPYSAEALEEFITKYLKGEVKPTIKSEPVPEKETVDGMTTIVGSRLRPLLAQGKDMMILFYAPWCTHCKSFHPIYDKVAKSLEKSDVIIAKMDATTNDVDSDDMTIRGFPTIYFIKAGSEHPIEYNGDRSVEAVIQFIKENASAKVESVDDEDL